MEYPVTQPSPRYINGNGGGGSEPPPHICGIVLTIGGIPPPGGFWRWRDTDEPCDPCVDPLYPNSIKPDYCDEIVPPDPDPDPADPGDDNLVSQDVTTPVSDIANQLVTSGKTDSLLNLLKSVDKLTWLIIFAGGVLLFALRRKKK